MDGRTDNCNVWDRTEPSRTFQTGRPDKHNSALRWAEYLGPILDLHSVKTTDRILWHLTTLFQHQLLKG
jgi:hypothetical protein